MAVPENLYSDLDSSVPVGFGLDVVSPQRARYQTTERMRDLLREVRKQRKT